MLERYEGVKGRNDLGCLVIADPCKLKGNFEGRDLRNAGRGKWSSRMATLCYPNTCQLSQSEKTYDQNIKDYLSTCTKYQKNQV